MKTIADLADALRVLATTYGVHGSLALWHRADGWHASVGHHGSGAMPDAESAIARALEAATRAAQREAGEVAT